MEFEELLRHLRLEYWGYLESERRQAEWQAQTGNQGYQANQPMFYDFLLSRGFSRQQLSAHGIGRDVEA
jgi:hypothetical protein